MKEYFYIVFIFIAFMSSLWVYRLGFLHYKLVAIIVTLDLVLEIWANILAANRHSNIAVYNVALLQEFWLYAFYYKVIITKRWVQRLILVYLYVLPIVWLVTTVLLLGIGHWNTWLSMAGSLFTILLSALYYHQLFTATRLVTLRTCFEFWIATALIIFFTCTLPFFGMLHYLTVILRSLAKKGFSPLQIGNIIFYSIVTYAFLCRINIRKSWRCS